MRIANLSHRGDERRVLAFVGDDDGWYPVADVARELGETVADRVWDADAHGWLGPGALALLRELASRLPASRLTAADPAVWRLGPPIPRPGKIIAVGRNYMDHVREGQEIWAKRGRTVQVPTFPAAFAKFPSSLTGPRDDIVLPPGMDDIDYEIELAVVIGSRALDVEADQALENVAGYAICNDVAARGIQRREMESQIGITLAKNFPTFAPMGPWLTTADTVGNPQSLQVTLEVDGDVRQSASTADMMFPVSELIAYWSRVGLDPGDILITGTPSGVALARDDPQRYYLRPGQSVVARIEKLGELRNTVR